MVTAISKANYEIKIPGEQINVLLDHPLLNEEIESIEDLQIFMEAHVFAVWDFMCLLKTLQNVVCPSNSVWIPMSRDLNNSARLINEIVLGEETDLNIDGSAVSHFELYIQSMDEIEADTKPIKGFIAEIERNGINEALNRKDIPSSSANFIKSTFEIINRGNPHEIAASFCFGREDLIPDMFQKILNQLSLTKLEAPIFHYYLERHIELDGDSHGPLAKQLVINLCEGDIEKIKQADQAAVKAVEARIILWDQVLSDIRKQS